MSRHLRSAETRIVMAALAGVLGLSGVLGLVGACSDSSSGGSGTTGSTAAGSDTASPSGTTVAVASTVPGENGVSTSSPPAAPTSTVGVGSGGSGTTAPGGAPDDTDPFASTPPPDPTEVDSMPGPPMEGCLDAEAGPASVELSFDDDDVRYAGAVAPQCLRIHAPQQLVVRSASGMTATVSIGADAFPLATNETIATAPLGVVFAVGDSFDVYIDVLDITVVVQVLP